MTWDLTLETLITFLTIENNNINIYIVTLETCYQSDKEAWPDKQKDNDKDKYKDSANDRDKDKHHEEETWPDQYWL